MSIARDIFCFSVPLKMLFGTVLSVATGVGGFWCPIYTKVVLVEVAFWYFSKKPLHSSSVADAIKFLMMLHYTCNGPFSGVISFIGVLDFSPRKKYPPALLRTSGSDM